jgi:hypothetical protein
MGIKALHFFDGFRGLVLYEADKAGGSLDVTS